MKMRPEHVVLHVQTAVDSLLLHYLNCCLVALFLTLIKLCQIHEGDHIKYILVLLHIQYLLGEMCKAVHVNVGVSPCFLVQSQAFWPCFPRF